MQVQPYLMFNGRCAEAVDFYRKTLGAEVEVLMRAKDSPQACPGRASEAAPRFEGFSDAARQDFLRLELRPGRRQVRRTVDDRHGELAMARQILRGES